MSSLLPMWRWQRRANQLGICLGPNSGRPGWSGLSPAHSAPRFEKKVLSRKIRTGIWTQAVLGCGLAERANCLRRLVRACVLSSVPLSLQKYPVYCKRTPSCERDTEGGDGTSERETRRQNPVISHVLHPVPGPPRNGWFRKPGTSRGSTPFDAIGCPPFQNS